MLLIVSTALFPPYTYGKKPDDSHRIIHEDQKSMMWELLYPFSLLTCNSVIQKRTYRGFLVFLLCYVSMQVGMEWLDSIYYLLYNRDRRDAFGRRGDYVLEKRPID